MKTRGSKKVTLDELVAQKLSDQLIDTIEKVEISRCTEWSRSAFSARATIEKNKLIIDVHTQIPIRKGLAILGSLVSLSWVGTHFTLPSLQALLDKIITGL